MDDPRAAEAKRGINSTRMGQLASRFLIELRSIEFLPENRREELHELMLFFGV